MKKRVNSTKDYNSQKMTENKLELRKLESEYVNSVVDNLPTLIEKKKKEITDKLIEFRQKCTTEKYTKNGEAYTVPNTNPMIIQNYFFKSLNPMSNVEPLYSAEKLGIVWDLYMDLVTRINVEISTVVPNLTSFCTFAGIRLSTFKNYKNSSDESMRILAEKIDDVCFNSNVTMSQMGLLNERSTLFRMKSEQERVEKERPVVHIHNDSVDLGEISKRLEEIKSFNRRKSKETLPIIEVKGEEIKRGYIDE